MYTTVFNAFLNVDGGTQSKHHARDHQELGIRRVLNLWMISEKIIIGINKWMDFWIIKLKIWMMDGSVAAAAAGHIDLMHQPARYSLVRIERMHLWRWWSLWRPHKQTHIHCYIHKMAFLQSKSDDQHPWKPTKWSKSHHFRSNAKAKPKNNVCRSHTLLTQITYSIPMPCYIYIYIYAQMNHWLLELPNSIRPFIVTECTESSWNCFAGARRTAHFYYHCYCYCSWSWNPVSIDGLMVAGQRSRLIRFWFHFLIWVFCCCYCSTSTSSNSILYSSPVSATARYFFVLCFILLFYFYCMRMRRRFSVMNHQTVLQSADENSCTLSMACSVLAHDSSYRITNYFFIRRWSWPCVLFLFNFVWCVMCVRVRAHSFSGRSLSLSVCFDIAVQSGVPILVKISSLHDHGWLPKTKKKPSAAACHESSYTAWLVKWISWRIVSCFFRGSLSFSRYQLINLKAHVAVLLLRR